jgi:hypothetical protein
LEDCRYPHVPSRRFGRVGRLLLALATDPTCPRLGAVAASGNGVAGRWPADHGRRGNRDGRPDDDGQFNYTDYERSALQLLRLGLTASFRPIDRIALVTELRAEGDTNGGPWTALPFAAYVRIRPWKDRPFDIQAGRIPPVFGAAGRRIYSNDNVLIGYPLAWQYLTVLRTDAVPSSADELIYARSAGWRPWYSVGTPGYAHGVPLTTAFRYDTGVEARVGAEHQRVSFAAAVTAGTLSSPGARTTNGGPQFSTRLALRPATGLIVAASFADGRFLAEHIAIPLPASGSGYGYTTAPLTAGRYHQQTWGADGEYSLGHFLVRAELVTARWRLPAIGATPIDEPLRSTAFSVEGRYRLFPGVTAAARIDHQSFNMLRGSHEELPWDAPVTRVEGGVAWSGHAKSHRPGIGAAQRSVARRGSLVHATRAAGDGVVLDRVRTTVVLTGVAAMAVLPVAGPAQTRGVSIRGRVELQRPAALSERRPSAGDLGDGPVREVAERRRAVVYFETAPKGAFEDREGSRVAMDQRHETFVPHLLAITGGDDRGFPEQRTDVSQRVLAVEGQAFRPGSVCRRALESDPIRSSGDRARLLRHPFAYERLHPGVQPPLLQRRRR